MKDVEEVVKTSQCDSQSKMGCSNFKLDRGRCKRDWNEVDLVQ